MATGAVSGATAGSAFGPWGTVIGGAVGAVAGGLSSYFGASAEEEAKKKAEEQRARARGYLQGYGYQLYDSPYQSFYDQYINQYLTGDLTQGQENSLSKANAEGLSNISINMANRGGTLGGQLAATQRHNADITSQRASMIDQNIGQGMTLAQNSDNFNLQQWLQKQQADMRYKELMAQYA
jgi:hypothetical protein